MNTDSMKLLRVRISLSDPWDLGESLNWQPVFGKLVKISLDVHGGRALIELDQPISYKGTTCQFAVAVPRHEGKNLEVLDKGGKVFCGFTGVSNEHAVSEAALSTDHWRGGLAFIGDIEAST
jgi:hypothetical protein